MTEPTAILTPTRGAPAAHPLTAGLVRALLAGPDLRYVRVGGVEAVRRVYVGVRDAGWGTIEPVVHDLSIEHSADGFDVTFNAEHVANDVDFAWRGMIAGRSFGVDEGIDASIRFEIAGVARRTFRTCRTGICVLHPIVRFGDRSCEIEHTDGSRERSQFPSTIAPQQPFTDIRAMSHQPAADLRATVSFEGEVFETEDQRNWSDSSFKTYCRPLSRPFPYLIERGERVHQAVTIRLSGRTQPDVIPIVEIDSNKNPPTPVPAIGARLAPLPLTATEQGRLLRMHPAHLRVDLCPDAGDWRSTATMLLDQAAQIDAAVELALHLTPADANAGVSAAAELLRRQRPRLCRVIVYEVGRAMASPDLTALVRDAMPDLLQGVPFGVGTIGAFTELNRNRPPAATVDLVAYPVNPQVHSTDDLTLVENLEAQQDTVTTTRQQVLPRPGHIAVGPVTLVRRPDPFAGGQSDDGEAPLARPDPRQAGLLGAAWTLASISRLRSADSITYYDVTGSMGIITPGGVTPLYHVLADIGEYSAGRMLGCASGDPLRCAAIAIRQGSRTRLLVANLLNDGLDVQLGGVERYRLIGRLELSARTISPAMQDAERFRDDASRRLDAPMPTCLSLPPYGVFRLDLEESTS